jgi:predicted PurR-regulated permease PerM
VSAGEIAAVIGSVVGTLVVIGFFVAFLGLLRTLRRLTESIEELRAHVVPLAGQWRQTVDQANAELTRVDGLITSAESVSQTVDSASRLAYLALSNPVIKLLAFTSGTGAALRRFRRTPGSPRNTRTK